MYLHSDNVVQHHDPLLLDHSLQGLGFGGSLPRPRLFIPESLEHCTADYLDKTFSPGHLLPTNPADGIALALYLIRLISLRYKLPSHNCLYCPSKR
jgi:hypothetical protein